METAVKEIPTTAITTDAEYVDAASALVAVAKAKGALTERMDPEIKAAYAQHKLLVAERKKAIEKYEVGIEFLKDSLVSYFDSLGGDTLMPDEVVPLVSGVGWKSNWTGKCTDIKALAAAVAAGTVSVEALEINKKWLTAQIKAQHDMLNVPGCEANQQTVLAVFTKEGK